MNGTIEHGTDANFDQIVTGSDVPVLVDFSAPWCGPCKQVEPVLADLASEYAGRARIVKINVDENQQVAATMGIRSIPSVILFHKGEAGGSLIGARPKADYQNLLDSALAN